MELIFIVCKRELIFIIFFYYYYFLLFSKTELQRGKFDGFYYSVENENLNIVFFLSYLFICYPFIFMVKELLFELTEYDT